MTVCVNNQYRLATYKKMYHAAVNLHTQTVLNKPSAIEYNVCATYIKLSQRP